MEAAYDSTMKRPLDWVAMGRSGYKSSDANLRLSVRHDDEYDTLRRLLSTVKLRSLLDKDDEGTWTDRCETPCIKAAHLLLKDHLD